MSEAVSTAGVAYGRRGGPSLTRVFVVGLLGLYLFPFAYVIYVALLDPAETMSSDVQFWPPKFGNFADAWFAVPFGRYYLNTLFVALAITVGSTLTSILAAYVFARTEFRGKTLLFFAVIATLMIPGHVTLIPNYLTLAKFGLLNSYWALVLPFLANGFSVFFLRQFMLGIPREVEEAARLDGAGLWRTLWDVIVPMSMPAIVAVSLFVFLSEWNSFIWPLIATSSEEMRTIQIGLAMMYREEAEQGLVNWPLVMAGSVIVLLPTILAFAAAERQLVRGIAMGPSK